MTVIITRFSSTTHDMTNAVFQVAPATGDTFTSNSVSVPVQNSDDSLVVQHPRNRTRSAPSSH